MEELSGKETLHPVRVIADVKDFHPSHSSSDEWNLIIVSTTSNTEDFEYVQNVISNLPENSAAENVVVSLQNGFSQQQQKVFVHGLTYMAATSVDAGTVIHKAEGDTILPPGITIFYFLFFYFH